MDDDKNASRVHWHVATGLASYGADASNGWQTATTMTDLADLVRSELENQAERHIGLARLHADSGDYKAAWGMRKFADRLDILWHSFNNERAAAPLYAGDPEKWDATVRRLVEKHFPMDVDGGKRRVHVWECRWPDRCDTFDEYLSEVDPE